MGERTEKFLDVLADGSLGQSRNLRVFWNAVPHVDDEDHPEDKDWSASETDPKAP